jgi:hypothetical protein
MAPVRQYSRPGGSPRNDREAATRLAVAQAVKRQAGGSRLRVALQYSAVVYSAYESSD